MNLFEKIGDYFGTGNFTLGKAVTLGLGIITPIFLFVLTPFIVWIAIPAEHRYDEKYYWLQDMSWIWPVCWVGIGFLSAIGWMIYNYVKDTRP